MTCWEYLTLANKMPLTDQALDTLGADGWDLVSYHVSSTAYHYIFKRPLVEPSL